MHHTNVLYLDEIHYIDDDSKSDDNRDNDVDDNIDKGIETKFESRKTSCKNIDSGSVHDEDSNNNSYFDSTTINTDKTPSYKNGHGYVFPDMWLRSTTFTDIDSCEDKPIPDEISFDSPRAALARIDE